MIEFKIMDEYIELNKLLKITRLAVTGGHAKMLIVEKEVKLNGVLETRKRAKIRLGDLVECSGEQIKIV